MEAFLTIAAALGVLLFALPVPAEAEGTSKTGDWVQLTDKTAFSIRDTSEDLKNGRARRNVKEGLNRQDAKEKNKREKA